MRFGEVDLECMIWSGRLGVGGLKWGIWSGEFGVADLEWGIWSQGFGGGVLECGVCRLFPVCSKTVWNCGKNLEQRLWRGAFEVGYLKSLERGITASLSALF
jgi:hypothetical protein